MVRKKSESSASEMPAKKKKKRTIKTNYSDIPEASNAQLTSMRRVGRPPLGESARRLIAIRIDPQVLFSLQEEARKKDTGYQSLINEILAKHIEKAS